MLEADHGPKDFGIVSTETQENTNRTSKLDFLDSSYLWGLPPAVTYIIGTLCHIILSSESIVVSGIKALVRLTHLDTQTHRQSNGFGQSILIAT